MSVGELEKSLCTMLRQTFVLRQMQNCMLRYFPAISFFKRVKILPAWGEIIVPKFRHTYFFLLLKIGISLIWVRRLGDGCRAQTGHISFALPSFWS